MYSSRLSVHSSMPHAEDDPRCVTSIRTTLIRLSIPQKGSPRVSRTLGTPDSTSSRFLLRRAYLLRGASCRLQDGAVLMSLSTIIVAAKRSTAARHVYLNTISAGRSVTKTPTPTFTRLAYDDFSDSGTIPADSPAPTPGLRLFQLEK